MLKSLRFINLLKKRCVYANKGRLQKSRSNRSYQKEMLDTIKEAFNKGTNAELADFLDVTEAKINNLRTGGTNSPKSVAELMKKLAIAVRKHAISNAYSSIAEILPLEYRLSKQEKSMKCL